MMSTKNSNRCDGIVQDWQRDGMGITDWTGNGMGIKAGSTWGQEWEWK